MDNTLAALLGNRGIEALFCPTGEHAPKPAPLNAEPDPGWPLFSGWIVERALKILVDELDTLPVDRLIASCGPYAPVDYTFQPTVLFGVQESDLNLTPEQFSARLLLPSVVVLANVVRHYAAELVHGSDLLVSAELKELVPLCSFLTTASHSGLHLRLRGGKSQLDRSWNFTLDLLQGIAKQALRALPR